MKNNVCVVGLGFVGLTLSVALARKGFKVYGAESNDTIRETLKKGIPHFFEPGLDKFLKRYIGNQIFIEKSVEDFKNEQIDYIIISVGTPYNKSSSNVLFDGLYNALDSISKIYTGEQHIILRSTVSVGTTRKIVLPYFKKLILGLQKSDSDILLSFCPERTIEGSALTELNTLPQIVGSLNDESLKSATDFWSKISAYVVNSGSLESAELLKLFNNTYRDIQFSIGNYFNEIAQSFGIDGVKMIELCNFGYSRSDIAKPGFVGGPCLEKDSYILTSNLLNSSGKDFVLNSRKFNENLEYKIFDWVQKNFNNSHRIGITGLAFKGKPVTSDLRGSNSINLCKYFINEEFNLNLHDFSANKNEIIEMNLGDYYESFNEFIKDSDVIIISNNHPNYYLYNFELDLKNKIIIDLWSVLDKEYFNSLTNVKYYTLGNLFIQSNNI
jgi:UDP-N-acetyl-D-mannosaminuronic acid dehydrogenase